MERRNWKVAYLFVSPGMLIIFLLSFLPLVFSLIIAFTNLEKQVIGDFVRHGFDALKFVGFENFRWIIKHDGVILYKTLQWNIVWTFINVFFHVSLGISLAIMLNNKWMSSIEKTLWRFILILPWAIPAFVTILVWRAMFYEDGFINAILKTIGIGAIPWMTSPFWARVAVLIINIWLGVPFMMIIALGALQSIPNELYEAASVDGATPWQKTKYITIPLVLRIMMPSILLGIIWTFNKFDVIWLYNKGGPVVSTSVGGHLYTYGATNLLITYMYSYFYNQHAWNIAAALGYIVFFVLLAISLINMKLQEWAEG